MTIAELFNLDPNDPQYIAEKALLALTEAIIQIHCGQPKGKYRADLRSLEGIANVLIYKRRAEK